MNYLFRWLCVSYKIGKRGITCQDELSACDVWSYCELSREINGRDGILGRWPGCVHFT